MHKFQAGKQVFHCTILPSSLVLKDFEDLKDLQDLKINSGCPYFPFAASPAFV